jgi:hypothetical protein
MNKVSPAHIRRVLMINDVLLSFQLVLSEAQARREIAEVVVKRGEPKKDRLPVLLRSADGWRVQVAIVPDAFIAIKFDARNYGIFFVELDRTTLSIGRRHEMIQSWIVRFVYHINSNISAVNPDIALVRGSQHAAKNSQTKSA